MEGSRWRAGQTAVVVLVIQITACLAEDAQINRGSFPEGFVFGTASSAFQVRSLSSLALLYTTNYYRFGMIPPTHPMNASPFSSFPHLGKSADSLLA
ncbi:hypothetical protein SAY86_031245 [Trapa natans]|uniref:Beta-glucosidase n=1 Tax=Trapa natans TaxID=22666 RepID=A0AAN7R5Q8_TRANT|nr:hypothetical protein SAY86_031245 [Trapa natans]